MRQYFWKKSKQKKVNHSEVTMMSRHGKLPQKQKWTVKNEFSIFEAETYFIDHLEVTKFPVIKKMKLELLLKNF